MYKTAPLDGAYTVHQDPDTGVWYVKTGEHSWRPQNGIGGFNTAEEAIDWGRGLLPEPGSLRVWWIPQVPGKPFYVSIKTVVEGLKLLDVLADYDQFQFDHNIKPDFCNMGGIERYEPDETEGGHHWVELTDEDGNPLKGWWSE